MCGLMINLACLDIKVYFDGTSELLTGCEKFYGMQMKNKKKSGSEKYFRHCGNKPFSSTLKEVEQSGYCQKLQVCLAKVVNLHETK